MTRAQFEQYFSDKGIEGVANFLVDNNPRAVYEFLRENYPDALPVWAVNYESIPTNKRRMVDLVIVEANKTNNQPNYIAILASNVPYNPNVDNWTKHT